MVTPATIALRSRRLLLLACSVVVVGCGPRTTPGVAPAAAAVIERTVARSQCFPVEQLPPRLRAFNEQLLLDALDSEALYTILATIKPVSGGFAQWRIDLASPEVEALDDARQALRTWTCGEALAAGAHHFAQIFDDQRAVQAWVARRPQVQDLVKRRSGFFHPLGVTPHADLDEVLLAVEHAEPSTRFRGYGWLFGYPDYAVDFFVEAARSEKRTGEFVKRDARSVPVFKRPTNAFVWVRPVGAADTAVDVDIEARATPVLAAYRQARARYIGPGKPGVVEMLREWLCDRRGRCGGAPHPPAWTSAPPTPTP
ncbi:MAG TPA: hypothetical protein VMF13_22660 [Luteitalea sp.]|nr:hypothetical protein [Luteitalea sp.]